jgi:soluble lytic murein transglycosylase-like protein
MNTAQRVIKKHKANLTPRSDATPVPVQVDDSARLREIRQLVRANNKSTLDTNLVICQIFMESRFDELAQVGGSAKGLMQLQLNAVRQVYKYRIQKQSGHMPSDSQTERAFADGLTMHNSPQIFEPATNIQLGTEYMQYWVDQTPTIDAAYKRYRGKSNGIYYNKIKACADRLTHDPDNMELLRDMVKVQK